MLVKLAALTLAVFATEMASDSVAGKWIAQTPAREGGMTETEFLFKVRENQLTGTVTSAGTTWEIQEGSTDGAQLEFLIVVRMGPREVRMRHTGVLDGNRIKFKRVLEDFARTFEFEAHRKD